MNTNLLNMKKYILIVLTAVSIAACTNKSENTTENSQITEEAKTTNLAQTKVEIAPENLSQTEFKIEGMTCQMGCANTIKTKLEALTGVDKADVNFENANAIVYFDKTVLSIDDLKNTINTIADGKLYKVVE